MEDNYWRDNRNQSGGGGYMGRKPNPGKFGDNKAKNYSPSTSYNYSPNGRGQGQSGNYQQHPRRRVERFKKESINYTEKLVKQNDIIIKLLKDIRDKLIGPEPVEQSVEQNNEAVRIDGQEQEQASFDDTADKDLSESGAEEFEQADGETDDQTPENNDEHPRDHFELSETDENTNG